MVRLNLKNIVRTAAAAIMIFTFACSPANAQQVKYVSGHNEWNPDSLGNQRAIVKVSHAAGAASTCDFRGILY